jgi:flagellar hook-basal body complex protein FliE
VADVTAIRAIGGRALEPAPIKPPALAGGEGPSFGEALGQALGEVNRLQQASHDAATELAAGRGNTLDTVVAIQQADVAFQLVVQVRNKLLEAYQEVMRMQV